MKIQGFTFKNNKQSWSIENVSFDSLNLLVGTSGAGKTRILRALDLVCDVAKDRRKRFDDIEWTINFSHLSRQYQWELKTSSASIDLFSNEIGTSEVVYERLIEFKDDREQELISRKSGEAYLDGKRLPKLKKTESALALLVEEEAIAPVVEAFKRFIFNETPQGAVFSIPDSFPLPPDADSLPLSIVSKADLEVEDFKQRISNFPSVLKMYLTQQLYCDSLFEEIKQYYTEIFPNVEDINISLHKQSSSKSSQLLFQIKEKGLDNWISQYQMSSGMYRTLVCLAEVISAPKESVIIIDEFENSLGINCMPELTDFIMEKTQNLQLILTSHHPYTINNIPWKMWQVVSSRDGMITSTKATDIPDLDTASSLDKFTQLITYMGGNE